MFKFNMMKNFLEQISQFLKTWIGVPIKLKTKHTTLLEQFQNQIKKNVERGKIDTPNTHTHESSLSWLGTDTSIKSGRVKIV